MKVKDFTVTSPFMPVNKVVCSHPGTGFHYSGFREYWNQVPVFDNFSESWEIVPLFGEIPNTGTKFQYDALAQ